MAKLLLGGKAEGACTGEVWRMGGGEGEGCEGGGEATTACGQTSALVLRDQYFSFLFLITGR